jgi:hypothetical protein
MGIIIGEAEFKRLTGKEKRAYIDKIILDGNFME